MKNVTVVNLKKDISYIGVGERITFKKQPSAFDENEIIAYYEGTEIGKVASSPTLSAPDTLINTEVLEEVGDEFTGVVESQFELVRKKAVTTLIVRVEGSFSSTPTAEAKTFTFKCSGSSTKYGAKMSVIDDYNSGKKVFLSVATDDKVNKVVLKYNGELSGAIEEKEYAETSSLEDLDALKSILESAEEDSIEAKVIKTLKGSYYVEISISSEVIDEAKKTVSKKAIGTVKANLISQGFEEERLNEIENFLLTNNFSAEQIQNIFGTYKMYPMEVQHKIPSNPSTKFNDTNDILKIAYAVLDNKLNALCSGEKGTGKNCFIETVAWIYQRPLYSISINRETDKADLTGSKIIDCEVDENGNVLNKIAYDKEVLIEAMEIGGILNIDEINFAEPGITGLLHSIGDDRRSIQVPAYKFVEADDNFTIMATMNLDYQGTNELNEALQDRFVDILFENNNSILDVLEKTCIGIKHADMVTANNVYMKMIEIIRNREAGLDEGCITVRGFIQALKLSKTLGLNKALEVCVANKVKDYEYRKNIKDIIDVFAM